MGTVTGLTADRMEAIEAASVVSGAVDGGTGHLILTKHDGSTVDAGNVKGATGATGPTGPTGPASIKLDAWPIGSIFISAVSTSPAVLLGGGSWSRFGQGRVLVSQDSSQTEFDTVSEVGGSKTHSHDLSDLGQAQIYTRAATPGIQMRRVATAAYTPTNAAAGTAATVSGADSLGTALAGATDAEEALPPYIVVYMWQRTA